MDYLVRDNIISYRKRSRPDFQTWFKVYEEELRELFGRLLFMLNTEELELTTEMDKMFSEWVSIVYQNSSKDIQL